MKLQLPLPDMHQVKISITNHFFIPFLFIRVTSLCSIIQTPQKPGTD